MTENKDTLTKLLHDIKAKCSSLKSAADLFKDCSAEEKKEMISLMSNAAKDITKHLSDLEKNN
jgi:hypothetical protein